MSVETITLTDTSRLVVSYDEDCQGENPREWREAVSVHPLRLHDHFNPPAPGLDSHGSDVEEILEWLPLARFERGYREARDEAIAKHFTRAGIPFIIHEYNSYRDYVGDFVWYVEPDSTDGEGWTIDSVRSEIETYEKWAAGEVYNVDLERLETWVKLGEHGEATAEMRDDWERVESIGGCYLDDEDYPAEVVAYEHWTLTDEEVAAMEVKLAAYRKRMDAITAAREGERA